MDFELAGRTKDVIIRGGENIPRSWPSRGWPSSTGPNGSRFSTSSPRTASGKIQKFQIRDRLKGPGTEGGLT
jgi:hypothetical protein